MGLTHPQDLTAWRSWQQGRQRARRVREGLRPSAQDTYVLTTFGSDPSLLVAIDSNSPTSRASLLEPLRHLDVSVAVLAADGPFTVPGHTAAGSTTVDPRALPPVIRGIRGVVSLGHYMPRGGLVAAWAHQLGVPHFVVQHGALTPFAPPLPQEARLLTWSEADADFWTSGRADVAHEVVGSQLLWRAGQGFEAKSRPPTTTTPDDALTYLGQMHAAELPRMKLAQAAATFCRAFDATYRPHPSERDKISRLTHEGFRHLGITVDGSTPLADLGGPVVSVFSTGVLEAAAQGRDAWVDCPRPPAWIEEFWGRYGMRRFGDAPTPAPTRSAVEPAQLIADSLLRAVES